MPKIVPSDYILQLTKKGMSAEDIARKTGCARSTVFNTRNAHRKKMTERILNDNNLAKIRETILGDKKPEDLVDLAKASVEVKMNIVEQLVEINKKLIQELEIIEKELKNKDMDFAEKDKLRDQKRKMAQEIRAQQKFGTEIATFVKEIDFRRIVMEEINQENPEVAERIYGRLRNKL